MLHQTKIETITGQKIKRTTRFTGGMIGDVFRVDLVDGQTIVAKVSNNPQDTLNIEGQMLQYLSDNSQLPVPEVIHSENQLLLMTYIQNSGGIDASVERDAAHQLVALHNITSDKFGLTFDNLLGPVHQPNPQMDSWIDFYREHRLLYMADVAVQYGNLSIATRKLIDTLANKLDNLLIQPQKPSLIHGDLWAGNVLVEDGKIAGLIDPATYYAHNEMELAYIALFGTFGQSFFREYHNLRPIATGFFQTRQHIYALYHLLIHVALFGGGYISQTENVVRKFVS